MNNIKYITYTDVQNIVDKKSCEDVIIFLSGPTSKNTPLSILRSHDVITVNGSAEYLLNHSIEPFIYLLTDARFLHQRRSDFFKFSSQSKFTIVNRDVYEESTEEDKKYLRENCLILKSFYKREKGGLLKKMKFSIMSKFNKSLLIDVPYSTKNRLVGFSKDISIGYCSCHTVAYTAIQVAYSLKFVRIICSGLDLTGSCQRFYDESKNPMPSELSRDLGKILPFFKFMSEKVQDVNVFNLSNDTAVSYNVIPFIQPSEIGRMKYKSKEGLEQSLDFEKKADHCVG